MSPISSRKIVPPSATSNRPRFRPTAPVNAPRSWPNSSLSISSGGIAAQLTLTNAPATRAVAVDRARDQLLAGAALAGDQDAAARRRDLRDLAPQLLHHRASAEQLPARIDRARRSWTSRHIAPALERVAQR